MGKTQGDVGRHGPYLWDGPNVVMGGTRTDGIWDSHVRSLKRLQEFLVSS